MSEQRGAELDTDQLAAKIHVVAKGDLSKVGYTKDEARSAVAEGLHSQREGVLQLPSQEDGINMTRVHAYRERIGIPRKELRILSPDDYAKALEVVGLKRGTEGGKYLPQQDIIIIKRDPESEELNGGPEFVEGLAIHEIAHSGNERSVVVAVKPTRRLLRKSEIEIASTIGRSGFVTTKEGEAEPTGSFLEEGYAELERGRYVVEELGKPDGFGGQFLPDRASPFDQYSQRVRNNEGKVVVSLLEGAPAAAVFELIAKHDPEFVSTLRESRHSVQGLREVARRLNAVSPSLYMELRRINVKTEESYREGIQVFKKVKNILEARATSEAPKSEPPKGE